MACVSNIKIVGHPNQSSQLVPFHPSIEQCSRMGLMAFDRRNHNSVVRLGLQQQQGQSLRHCPQIITNDSVCFKHTPTLLLKQSIHSIQYLFLTNHSPLAQDDFSVRTSLTVLADRKGWKQTTSGVSQL